MRRSPNPSAGRLRRATRPTGPISSATGRTRTSPLHQRALGAARIAASVHARVAGLAVAQAALGPGFLTVSIGVAVAGTARNLADLYRLADEALYAAKAGGRNQTRSTPEAA
ncbi:diguanylate cyclase [Methylobacterium sp. CB376]|uniref:diguanylate cyclase domain-containing protein n=1 Tax=unclassified Methylobacterium TaxID=2615210 RepID=UPI000A0237AC|nr:MULTISPECIES: diguanylate cyclase [Methylobacterium]WFT79355.1 diguanylate cyclase [Methylobacterium nodulans]